MRIKKMTASFGRLERAGLELGEGLNLVYAPNEGGKSTWAAFWKTMLYGLDTRDRDRKGHLADKNRYLPWSGLPMEGEVLLEREGRDILLRRWTRGSAPMGAFSATYAATGEKVPGLDAACGAALTGAGREVFERSAFIGAGGELAVTAAPELEKRIAALVSSGEEDVSFSQTEGRLREWLNRRKVNRSVGLIPRLEGELQRVRETQAALEDTAAENARLEADRAQLEERRRELAAEGEVHRRLAQRSLDMRCAQAGAELREAEEAQAALEREFAAYGPLPGRDALREAQGELQYLKVLDGEIKQGEEALRGAEAEAEAAREEVADPLFPGLTGEDALRAAGEVRRGWEDAQDRADRLGMGSKVAAVLAGAILIILAGLLVMFQGSSPVPLPLGLLCVAVPAGLSVWFSRRVRQCREDADGLLERYGVREPEELEDLAEAYRERCRAADEAERYAGEVRRDLERRRERRERGQSELLAFVRAFAPQVTNRIGCSAALSRALGFDHELALARQRVEGCRRRRADLEAQGGRDLDTAEFLQPPARTPEETEMALAQVSGQLEQITGALNRVRGRRAALGDPAALAAKAEGLEEELERRREEYTALTLALDVLGEANTRLRERFSPALDKLAGEYLARLTGGRYSRLSLDRTMEGAAARTGDVLPRSSLYLSRGTLDQLYLAVRLAVCRLCLPQRPPIFLDDALAAFDDERLSCALDLLLELSREQQVVLFTCRRREGELLAGVPGVTRTQLE